MVGAGLDRRIEVSLFAEFFSDIKAKAADIGYSRHACRNIGDKNRGSFIIQIAHVVDIVPDTAINQVDFGAHLSCEYRIVI